MDHVQISQALPAFLEGIGLVLSPCILPILPIMLAASIDGGKRRPFGIIIGFIASFTGFALLSRQLLIWLNVDSRIVRDVAIVLLVVFGLVMLSKKLSDKMLGATQGLANFGQNLSSRWDQQNGFFGGVGIGALIGLIWTPCAGPIMAAALVQIAQAKNGSEATWTVVLFALGAGLPMLAIVMMGRQISSRLNFLKTHSYAVRRVMGVIIIATAMLIYEGADVKLLASLPGSDNVAPIADDGMLQMALDHPYPAHEFTGIKDWVNSSPLKLSDLHGKVVLVDFWTYSCINCVRTLPVITSWDAKYRDKGLVIIGIHSPEFPFEKKLENVKDATERFGIHYPVALDSDLATWNAFHNQYWPAHYLIDKDGNVVYTHFGEGEYERTEHNIRVLLGLAGNDIGQGMNGDLPTNRMQTQETYLGYARTQNFASLEEVDKDEAASYAFATPLSLHHWALSGDWTITADNITSDKVAAGLRLNFLARKVFLVLGTKSGNPQEVHVLLNGKPASSADVKDGKLIVDGERLYELIDQESAQNGTLELQTDTPGLQAYAFTFGG